MNIFNDRAETITFVNIFSFDRVYRKLVLDKTKSYHMPAQHTHTHTHNGKYIFSCVSRITKRKNVFQTIDGITWSVDYRLQRARRLLRIVTKKGCLLLVISVGAKRDVRMTGLLKCQRNEVICPRLLRPLCWHCSRALPEIMLSVSKFICAYF